MNNFGRTVHVLLVDDDEIDAEQIVRAFRHLKIANPITTVTNGIEALNALRGEEGHARLLRPYVILLDINMPRMNGLEFLRAIRADEELKRSIVFVLTTSKLEEDIKAAYNDHVAGYFLKSSATAAVWGLPTMMENYWRVAELPRDK